MNNVMPNNGQDELEKYTYIEAVLENMELMFQKIEELEEKEKRKDLIIKILILVQSIILVLIIIMNT